MTDPENYARVGEEIAEPDSAEPGTLRGRIEPRLSAVLQSEHLALLLGNGFTTAIAGLAQTDAPSMDAGFSGEHADRVEAAASASAARLGRTHGATWGRRPLTGMGAGSSPPPTSCSSAATPRSPGRSCQECVVTA